MPTPRSDRPGAPSELDHYLVQVYRDYPGLCALIRRGAQDPELAADIIQDAALTTLLKLRTGEISEPENVGGYLYRVALNQLRNYRRKSYRVRMSSVPVEGLPELQSTPDWLQVGQLQWAEAARRLLGEMPSERDRQILLRFYLQEQSSEQICEALQLSRPHFARVIFRARHRFRTLLEKRGLSRAD